MNDDLYIYRFISFQFEYNTGTLWAMFVLVFCCNAIIQGMEFQMIYLRASRVWPIGGQFIVFSMKILF